LPKEIRDKYSNPEVLGVIKELEDKYAVNLAAIVMKVAINEIRVANLGSFLAEEFGMKEGQAGILAGDLKKKVFDPIGYPTDKKPDNLPDKDTAKISIDIRKDSKTSAPSNLPFIDNKEPEMTKPSFKTAVATGTVPRTEGNFQVLDFSKVPPKPALSEQKDRLVENPPVAKEPAGPIFFFSPEDEEEVKKLAEKVGNFAADKTDLEAKLGKVLKEFSISFSSSDLAERFKNIIRTYVFGIRKRIEARLALTRPADAGGMGFDEALTDKILNFTDQELSTQPVTTPPAPPKIPVPEDKLTKDVKSLAANGARDFEYDLKSALEMMADSKKTDGQPANLATDAGLDKDELTKLNENLEKPREYSPRIEEADLIKKIEVKPALPKISDNKTADTVQVGQSFVNQSMQRMQSVVDLSNKPSMTDVKFIPKVMGPIEELRFLDLVNFRRLSSEPARAAAKLKEKIHFLEEEHFTKRLEAIKAWRQSPVNRLYLELGRQSIHENKPIEIVIEARKKAGQDYLTSGEFEAIMDLNKDLRF
jgi:hypothetical protein